jgi:hypothetical protein
MPTGDHVEEVSLSEYDARRYDAHSQSGASRGEAYHADEDSDSDEMGGHSGQHVQCAQQ